MSFLYPLFLVAGAALAIPVLIHLFNLRRYKTVYFSNTRFLRTVQLTSQKQNKIKYKWLLLTRLLLLACLVLAFAQPFFPDKVTSGAGKLQIIYLDNSQSMAAKAGARRLFDIAKNAVSEKVRKASPGARFFFITNDKTVNYQSVSADKIASLLNNTEIAPSYKTAGQVIAQAQNIVENEAAAGADLYYYADFQGGAPDAADTAGLHNISLHGIPVIPDNFSNAYIDTAWFTQPTLQEGSITQMVVKTRQYGKKQDGKPVVQLTVNGQVKTALNPTFADGLATDTLSFSVNDGGWQQMVLSVNDASIPFDDSFSIAAKSASALSVLVINQGAINPYIQTAFNAYKGFQLTQADISSTLPDLQPYSLVILNGITSVPEGTAAKLTAAIQNGLNCCIFPGKTANPAGINAFLLPLGDIRFTGLDTATQTVSFLQQQSDLVKDLFDNIPDNVQLPATSWHYRTTAGLNASQQSVMSFRNGDPFLAAYTAGRGTLYLAGSSADADAGNFAGSYFFVPFLYQMAVKAKGSDVFALTAGTGVPAYLAFPTNERNIIHLSGKGIDAIPPQQAHGSGAYIYVDQAAQQQGFYYLTTVARDTVTIALNGSRKESVNLYSTIADIKKAWKNTPVDWIDLDHSTGAESGSYNGTIPLWKVCVILAVFMLLAETFLLTTARNKKQNATQ